MVTSPAGVAPGDSQSDSQPKYTEEQFKGLQSSLSKQIADHKARADKTEQDLRAALDKIEEYEITKTAAPSKPDAGVPADTATRLSDLRRDRELKRQQEELARERLDLARQRLAVQHNLNPDELEGSTVSDLEVSALRKVIERQKSGKKPESPPLDRGAGQTPQGPISDMDAALTIVNRAMARNRS